MMCLFSLVAIIHRSLVTILSNIITITIKTYDNSFLPTCCTFYLHSFKHYFEVSHIHAIA